MCDLSTDFLERLQLDPLECTVEQLSQKSAECGLRLGSSWSSQDRDDWLNLLFAECIQPYLGWDQPVLVSHFPATQAALAAVSPEDPRTAERYELFVRGQEIANGYHELLDASELLTRSSQVLAQRRGDGKEDLAIENRLLDAMRAGMPDSCGCALGMDRLVMLLLDQACIDDVIAFPIERA